jgi:ABC-type tungstate transport system substrate-binding protein
MKSKKLYVLVVALGLAMVWLGVLFTIELTIVQKQSPALEQAAASFDEGTQQAGEAPVQTTGLSRGEALKEAGTGFPLLLAGVGVVFIVGGAVRCRHQ